MGSHHQPRRPYRLGSSQLAQPLAPQAPRSDMPGCPDGAPNTRIWTAHLLTSIQPSAAQIADRIRAGGFVVRLGLGDAVRYARDAMAGTGCLLPPPCRGV